MAAGEADKSTSSGFKSTLIRVLIVQVLALAFLWALQARYHVL